MSDEIGSAPAGNPSATPVTPPATDWTSSFDDSTKGIIQTKGWKSPADVVGSYANLEKLLGAEKAGRAVVPPKADGTPEEWAAFYNKMGRPEKADGYNIQAPEGGNDEFAKSASTWFHEAGLTPKQAEVITAKWNEHINGTMTQQQEAFAQTAEVDVQELKKAWGNEFEAKSELARRALRESGLSKEEGQAIERALGVKKAAEVFAFLGDQFREAPMKGGEGQRSTFGITSQDAMQAIQDRRADPAWTARYLSGNADAKAEFDRLHQIAYPQSA